MQFAMEYFPWAILVTKETSQFNAKYDFHEDAVVFSSLLCEIQKLLVLQDMTGVFYLGLLLPKHQMTRIKFITQMRLGHQDYTLYCPGSWLLSIQILPVL